MRTIRCFKSSSFTLIFFIFNKLLDYIEIKNICLPGKDMAPGYTMRRRQADGGSVMPWAMFSWEPCAHGIDVDVSWAPTTYLNIVSDVVTTSHGNVFVIKCRDGSWFEEHDNKAPQICIMFWTNTDPFWTGVTPVI